MINKSKLDQLFEEYKEYFKLQWEEEKYKWEAVKHFQDNWDINAEDFAEMFKTATAKHQNLLSSGRFLPRDVILKLAKVEDNRIRQLFIELYDESKPLADRVDTFQEEIKAVFYSHYSGNLKYYQNTNAISVYLWFMYPDKYYIYKYSEMVACAKALESDCIPKGNGSAESMIAGYSICDEICEYIKGNEEWKSMLQNVITNECYPDKEFKTASGDFVYFLKVKEDVENNQNEEQAKHELILREDESTYEEDDMQVVVEPLRQEKYKLTITRDSITSTEKSFTMDNIHGGDGFKPLDVIFYKADGTEIQRDKPKGEQKISNQTLPRLAFQIFENQIDALSDAERFEFPICQYTPDKPLYKGIYRNDEEVLSHGQNLHETSIYRYGKDKQFIIYSWNIFTTVRFVQECLKRFGNEDDSFVLIYRRKEKIETKEENLNNQESAVEEQEKKELTNPYSPVLLESKNVIFRGAPGTGKTYLAREIAAEIVSDGYYDKYELLSAEQKQQIEFVQFHPSYDYTDFVEGLRPTLNDDGSMGFTLQDGTFKRFVKRARKNYEDSQKTTEIVLNELSVQDAMSEFFSDIEFGKDSFKTMNGNTFTITSVTDNHINISIPNNEVVKTLKLNINEVTQMLESGQTFSKVKDLTSFFDKKYATQDFSYDLVIYNEISKRKKKLTTKVKTEELKKYVFIIDEINRGEISKIFGELFFSIDPGYRGRAGEVSTQYANLHSSADDKFFIPENVYIIGTMNDIDRSVDSFDFAMRRRFRFIEIKADDRLEMLSELRDEDKQNEAMKRMTALNSEIAATDGLNDNYQIGASYFLKLKTIDFDKLWTDYLQPLLQEYINGMYDEEGIMERFMHAYGYAASSSVMSNEVN